MHAVQQLEHSDTGRGGDAEDAIVVARGVRKSYGDGDRQVDAVAGVDLAIRRGEFVAIMGPSGSGKSTLLHLLAGLERPSDGSVTIEGQRIDALSENHAARFRRRHIGVVFQFFNLVPTLDVEHNIALPLLFEGGSLRELRERIEEVLSFLDMQDRGRRMPASLSGGEMQRVAIARALLCSPSLILADEPTGNLDSARGSQVLQALRHACDAKSTTVVMVTHEASAAEIGDRVVRMRDGRLVSSDASGSAQ